MPKHAAESKDKKSLTFKQNLYDEVFQAVLGLKKQVIEWWKYSLESELVCTGCIDEDPRKLNNDGKCAFCNGEGYVPDKDQRNMAFKEAVARLNPAPKAVEMRIDDNRDKEELLKKYEGMPKEEVEKLLAQMNIAIKGEAEYVTSGDGDDAQDGGQGKA